jgi:hypothetical protein
VVTVLGCCNVLVQQKLVPGQPAGSLVLRERCQKEQDPTGLCQEETAVLWA